MSYLERLEGYLGRKITRTTFGTTFDSILRMKGGMLPSNHRRWCTEMMKLKPFENYIGNDFLHQLRGHPRRRGPNWLHQPQAQYPRRVPLPRRRDRLRRSSAHPGGFRPWHAAIHGMGPHAKRMLLLFLSAENRMGSPEADATRTCMSRQRPTKSRIRSTATSFTGMVMNRLPSWSGQSGWPRSRRTGRRPRRDS